MELNEYQIMAIYGPIAVLKHYVTWIQNLLDTDSILLQSKK